MAEWREFDYERKTETAGCACGALSDEALLAIALANVPPGMDPGKFAGVTHAPVNCSISFKEMRAPWVPWAQT